MADAPKVNDPLAGFYVDPSAPNAAPQQPKSDPLAGFYAGNSSDQVQNTSPDWDTSLTNTAKDVGIGAAKGAGSLLDFILGPTLQGINSVVPRLPGDNDPDLSKQPFSSAADKYLPDYNNKVVGKGAEGAVLGAPFGAIGAGIGAASGAGEEYLNENNPGHPIANALVPAAGSVLLTPQIIKQGSRAIRVLGEQFGLLQEPALVAAKRAQGVTAGTAASTSDEPFWSRMQRGARAIVFGQSKDRDIEGTINREQQQLGSAVQDQANSLFPNQTKQETGQGMQTAIEDGVDTVKRVFSGMENRLDAAINPNTTLVPMAPFVTRAIDEMASSPGAHVPIAGGRVQTGDKVVDRLMDNIIQYGHNQNGLPIQAIRELKQQVGDQLKESLLNGDANSRQLRQMYGVLADAQGAAYVNTPYAGQYTALKAAEAEMYNQIDAFAQPLIKQGLTPEKVADLATNQMKLGGTKLASLVNIMEQASPSIRNQMGSSILRAIGRDAQGDFSPQRFFTRWQQISPEAKQALFGQGANQDIPAAYDQLALIAQHQAHGAKALNTSGTEGTARFFAELGTYAGLAGGSLGYLYGSRNKNPQNGNDESGPDAGLGAGIGAGVGSTLGALFLARMMTNPIFIRWIATPVPVQDIPAHIKALSAVAGQAPSIADDVTKYQQYLEQQHDNNPQQKFAEGGPVDPAGGNTDIAKELQKKLEQLDRLRTENETGGNFPSFERLLKESTPKKMASGGEVQENVLDTILKQMPEQLAEGGSVDRYSQAVQYLVKETGMPEHAAQGAVKYMYTNESKLKPDIVNPTSKALGIGQWLGSRKTALLNTYGARPTFENQLEHIKGELSGSENNTLKALMNSKNEKEGYDIWGKLFERPGAQALVKAGVNYSPGETTVANGASHATAPNNSAAIINQIIPASSHIQEDTEEENPNQQGLQLAEQHANEAASMGADPLVQSVIKTIWSSANV